MFSYRRMAEEVPPFTDKNLGRLERDSAVTKRWRDIARQSHSEGLHARAKDHRKEQCRGRAIRSSIGSIRVRANRVAAERLGLRIEASAGH